MEEGTEMKLTEAAELIGAIREADSTMSKWEHDFVESIEEQIDNEEPLTPLQSTKLQEIYREVYQ